MRRSPAASALPVVAITTRVIFDRNVRGTGHAHRSLGSDSRTILARWSSFELSFRRARRRVGVDLEADLVLVHEEPDRRRRRG
jgi:hypothetical protein